MIEDSGEGCTNYDSEEWICMSKFKPEKDEECDYLITVKCSGKWNGSEFVPSEEAPTSKIAWWRPSMKKSTNVLD